MNSVISSLSAKLRTGEITSVALTERYLGEIEKNSRLNAYVYVTRDEALRRAAEADRIISEGGGGALTGIPFALKDNICTEGLPTTCCSAMLADFKPVYSATAYEKLCAAGAVLLGKTNMDEFAMGSTSETSAFGAPLNPLDERRVTGGSSGGSASVVAAGLAAFALGSDTGGSVRQPAAFCGTVGFKPSYGAVSRYGLIAYGSSLDQIGVLAHSVSDAACVFDAVKGRDIRDSTSAGISSAPVELAGEVKGLRIGLAREFFDGLDAGIAAAVKNAALAYERAGAEIIEVSLPELKTALPVYYIIACAEASSNLGRYDGIRYGSRAEKYSDADDMIVKTRSRFFGEEVKKRIMLGTYVLSSGYYDAYYKKACILRGRIRKKFKEVFSRADVLFAPTAPCVAFELGYAGGNSIQTYLSDVCTVPVNIAGLPAVSVPCGESDGMPIGLQIIGGRFCDERTLDAAYFAELNPLCCDFTVKRGVKSYEL